MTNPDQNKYLNKSLKKLIDEIKKSIKDHKKTLINTKNKRNHDK